MHKHSQRGKKLFRLSLLVVPLVVLAFVAIITWTRLPSGTSNQLQQQPRGHNQHISLTTSSNNSRPTTMSSQQQPAPAARPALPASARVVVIGGGLAGLTAALQAAECLDAATSCPGATCASPATPSGPSAVDVLLVEKMPRLGGNSAKASSGINMLGAGAGAEGAGVEGAGGGPADSAELFTHDVVESGGGASSPQLVERLVLDSPAALAFLESHGVRLPGTTRLGGHSVARTRTVTGGANVGWAIMSALTAAARAHPRIRVAEGYTLRRILTQPPTPGGGAAAGEAGAGAAADGGVAGVELAPAGPDGSAPASGGSGSDSGGGSSIGELVSCGSVVLATGGFAANRELLQSVAPQAAALATTNGPWARGEALRLAAAAGAALVGLEQVQVHPTGFVDPADPEAGTKFLAPEKLRGVGGLLLNDKGSRFVDELARRDVVAAAVAALPAHTAWLLLGRDAAQEYGSGPIDFYCSKGLMRKAGTLDEAAAALGAPPDQLRAELAAYAQRAETEAEAAAGGSAADPYGKRVFPHPPHPDLQLPLYLARVTPVVHYTMGGVAINERAEALREGGPGGRVVRVLYAAGEVSGGLHGHNRLGGNSLLECVVFGRIAGAQAAACSSG